MFFATSEQDAERQTTHRVHPHRRAGYDICAPPSPCALFPTSRTLFPFFTVCVSSCLRFLLSTLCKLHAYLYEQFVNAFVKFFECSVVFFFKLPRKMTKTVHSDVEYVARYANTSTVFLKKVTAPAMFQSRFPAVRDFLNF